MISDPVYALKDSGVLMKSASFESKQLSALK